jgi:hypothetical protein
MPGVGEGVVGLPILIIFFLEEKSLKKMIA